MQYEIANPKLWWCNGLGDANLYPFTVEISQKKQFLDSKKLNIGLRTIELIQEKDQSGKSFYFKLNGKSVFMKGANMVPPDSFLPRVSNSTYFSLVEGGVKVVEEFEAENENPVEMQQEGWQMILNNFSH